MSRTANRACCVASKTSPQQQRRSPSTTVAILARNRQEDRCVAVYLPGSALDETEWASLVAAVVRVERNSLIRSAATGQWTTRRETAFYASSVVLPAETFAAAIRNHWAIGVSSEGHAVMSVKVRPEPKNSGSEAREALWRESKTAEPSDNILERSMREASGCNVQ